MAPRSALRKKGKGEGGRTSTSTREGRRACSWRCAGSGGSFRSCASSRRSRWRSFAEVLALGGSPFPTTPPHQPISQRTDYAHTTKRLTLIIKQLPQQMEERKALLAARHDLHERARLRPSPLLLSLRRRPRTGRRRARELERHDRAADVAVRRVDDEVHDVLARRAPGGEAFGEEREERGAQVRGCDWAEAAQEPLVSPPRTRHPHKGKGEGEGKVPTRSA